MLGMRNFKPRAYKNRMKCWWFAKSVKDNNNEDVLGDEATGLVAGGWGGSKRFMMAPASRSDGDEVAGIRIVCMEI